MKNKAHIYLINSAIIIIENKVVARNHHHHAIKIAINPGANAKLVLNGTEIPTNTVIIDADITHSFHSYSDPVLFLLVNPESEVGSTIRQKYLNEGDAFCYDFNYNPHVENHFKELVNSTLCRCIILDIYHDIVHTLCGQSLVTHTIDERIEESFHTIELLEDKIISVGELASRIFLSESRFAHLFKEETKIPVRQYLAWLRLLDALKMIAGGFSFTEAAMESGFTDLPHLHKTFTHYFGVSLSDYSKNSRFIQVNDYSQS